MAEVCPSCGTAVEHDFGVTTCAGCGVVLFIDFDGKVQISTPETVSEDPVHEPAASEISPVQFTSELPPIPESFENVEPNFEAPVETVAESYELVRESEPEAEMPMVPPADFSSEDYLGSEEPAVHEVAPLEEPQLLAQAPQGPDETMLDFSDVVDFANRSELDNNSLYYLLRIEGIDHKDIRRKVESVLADPKLNFHLQDILPKIRGGVLELTNLPPIKASVIASRLREESVEFRWTQSIYDTSEVADADQTGADDESQSHVG